MGRTKKSEVDSLSEEFVLSKRKVIQILGVSKSSIYYTSKPYPHKRNSRFRKHLSCSEKEAILKVTSDKATYGIPRVRAILKRDYGITVSKYLLHRFLKQEGLLIEKGRKRGASRPHTGRIEVTKSNTRWASDITSIKCWNGQTLRFTYILDCCDRSIIAWKAGLTMQACDIELMMQEALIERFGNVFLENQKLEFLHDNGPEYIEKHLQKSLESWHITDCNTPTYSPQSNGMCEAFNGTFKRDYVYENCLENPKSVFNQIQKWVDEYNNYAPHSALGMKTPKEYFDQNYAA